MSTISKIAHYSLLDEKYLVSSVVCAAKVGKSGQLLKVSNRAGPGQELIIMSAPFNSGQLAPSMHVKDQTCI